MFVMLSISQNFITGCIGAVMLTTLGAASDENFIKMTTLTLQCNGLVPSGNKPLPKLMSTRISDRLCHHGDNDLNLPFKDLKCITQIISDIIQAGQLQWKFMPQRDYLHKIISTFHDYKLPSLLHLPNESIHISLLSRSKQEIRWS